MSDLINLFYGIILVFTVTVIIDQISRKNPGIKVLMWKIFQFFIGIVISVLPFYISSSGLLIASGITITFAIFLVKFKFIKLYTIETKKNWNVLNYAIVYFILTLLLLPHYKEIFFLSFFIYTTSNSLSVIAGKLYPGMKISSLKNDASLTGFAAFFISTLIILLLPISKLLVYFIPVWNLTYTESINPVGYIILISLIISVIEVFSIEKIKIYSVILIGSFLIYSLINSHSPILLNYMLIGFLLAGIIAALSYYVKFLTFSGSVATFLLAGFLFSFGQVKWSVPILTFFILSSLLSKYRKNVRAEVEDYFEKSGVRDHWQVFANGGFGGVLVIVNWIIPNDLFYLMYIATLSAVCADTWATEIGTLKNTATYNIITLKPIKQGMSGGISFIGTLGGFLGAIVISFSGIFWIEENVILYVVLIVFSGLVGSFFDSLLGATLQVQYKCSTCGKITEKTKHCNNTSEYNRGYIWMNNDIVNLMAGFAGLLVVYLFYNFM